MLWTKQADPSLHKEKITTERTSQQFWSTSQT